MDSSTIHALWQCVESMQVQNLLHLNDRELVHLLTTKLMHNFALSDAEITQVRGYISDRLPLIRDLVWTQAGWY